MSTTLGDRFHTTVWLKIWIYNTAISTNKHFFEICRNFDANGWELLANLEKMFPCTGSNYCIDIVTTITCLQTVKTYSYTGYWLYTLYN